jgi:hypothetical protein
MRLSRVLWNTGSTDEIAIDCAIPFIDSSNPEYKVQGRLPIFLATRQWVGDAFDEASAAYIPLMIVDDHHS